MSAKVLTATDWRALVSKRERSFRIGCRRHAFVLIFSQGPVADATMYHMRRREREIVNPDAMKKVLSSAKYVTVALCKDNDPYLVTLSHGYDTERDCIYFHCAKEGKKIDYIKANNKVWGQAIIDEGYVEDECDQLYTSVQFFGRVTLLANVDEKLRALTCMIQQLNKNHESLIAKLDPENLKNLTLGKIDIEFLSGKQSKRQK
jgi:nitroimidazol reductase NimA-like FMN-containing flavoprotein (pyridoxamine 5'-phosphate oxidase superfamily)